MTGFRTKYRNMKFKKERIDLDRNSYSHCEFDDCLIILEKGDTELRGCTFHNCRLMLRGQALQIAKFLQTFIGDKPLRVLDFSEPGSLGES